MKTTNETELTGLERCPTCHLLPDVKVENDFSILLQCERHGHMAAGKTLESAKENWNRYIAFVAVA